MNNVYFQTALNRARSVLGSKGRLLTLAVQLFGKLKDTQLSKDYWKERLFLIRRLLKAFANRQYREIPIKSILLLIAAVIYFINPLDLIPDAVIGLGLTDDLAILAGVYNLVSEELEKFRQWEASTKSRKMEL
jgi:uncharacterized membrane protein YkvA (DUF1232 family)